MGSMEFSGFRLDPVTRQLSGADGVAVPLTGRAFDVLEFLMLHRDRVVGREELFLAVWRGRVVEENNLSQAIATLRRAFGTDAGDHAFVLTVPGRGYRFVAPVHAIDDELPIAGLASAAPGAPEEAGTWRRPPLQRVVLGLAAVALLLAAWAVLVRRDIPAVQANAVSGIPARVMVLPFRPIGAPSNDAILELGMADTLITRLGDAPDIQVLSLDSVERFVGKDVEAVQAGQSLGVDYVVQGSTQRRGALIRVNAHLISLRDGKRVWTGTFDTPPDQVFTLQDDLSRAILQALSVRSLDAGPYRSPCDGADALAYRDYLRGRHLVSRPDPMGLPKAVAWFDRAIARDPKCARAWAGKAFAYRSMAMVSDRPPAQAFSLARDSVANALRIDPASAEAYVSLGVIQFWYDWDWVAAETSLRKAIALDPNLAEAHYALAHLLHNIGRNEEGLAHARRAMSLNPLSPLINTIASSFLATAGEVQEASRRIEGVLELDPGFWVALYWKAQLDARNGDMAGAVATMTRANEACRRCSHGLAGVAWLKARSGDEAGARALLREMQDRDGKGYFPATRLAVAYEGLGEREHALAALERAYDEHDLYLTFLLVDARLAAMGDEPRFIALKARMSLGATRGTALAP